MMLENNQSGLTIDEKISEGQKDELFKSPTEFARSTIFYVKGKYGEDFSIALNGEDLIYDKALFPCQRIKY